VKKLVGGEDVAEFVREMKGATKGSS
jgi:hypothetical protein